MKITNQEIIELSKNVRVSVLKYYSGKYEMAVLTNWYPHLSPDDWNIDYSIYDDVITVGSPMQVYGILQEIREEYGIKEERY